jgi:tetratricopeptide (TPR) repeat protein
LELDAQEGLTDQRAAIRNVRAELLMQLGRWDLAMEDIDKVMSSEKQLSDNALLTQALVASAQISSYYGDFTEAVSTLERACAVGENLQNRSARASVLLELGTVFARIGEMQQGREKFQEVEICWPPRNLSIQKKWQFWGRPTPRLASPSFANAAFRRLNTTTPAACCCAISAHNPPS